MGLIRVQSGKIVELIQEPLKGGRFGWVGESGIEIFLKILD